MSVLDLNYFRLARPETFDDVVSAGGGVLAARIHCCSQRCYQCAINIEISLQHPHVIASPPRIAAYKLILVWPLPLPVEF